MIRVHQSCQSKEWCHGFDRGLMDASASRPYLGLPSTHSALPVFQPLNFDYKRNFSVNHLKDRSVTIETMIDIVICIVLRRKQLALLAAGDLNHRSRIGLLVRSRVVDVAPNEPSGFLDDVIVRVDDGTRRLRRIWRLVIDQYTYGKQAPHSRKKTALFSSAYATNQF